MATAHQEDALLLLGPALDEAVAEGVLTTAPKGPDDDEMVARRRVIGLYLFLLGYLDRHPASGTGQDRRNPHRDEDYIHRPGKKVADRDIETALFVFQRDAGLTEDGWAGAETWGALQSLASFEHPTHLDDWFDGDSPRPALIRAAHLRLFAFGMTKFAPKPESNLRGRTKERHNDFQSGLNRFVQAAGLLNLADDTDLQSRLTRQTLAVLFDQDHVVFRINRALADGIASGLRGDNKGVVDDFLQGAARIELWLYGHNIQLGNFKKGGPFIDPSRNTKSLRSAMDDFAQDQGRKDDFKQFARRDWDGMYSWFFDHLVALDNHALTEDHAEEADTSVDRVLNDKAIRAPVRKTVKSLGARLMDGMRRVWNWVRSIWTSAKKIAKQFVLNLSRFLYDAASSVYRHIVTAIRAVVEGIEFLNEKVVRGSDPAHMMVFHDKDMDFDVFINTTGAPERIENLSKRIALRSEILGTGTSIISTLGSFLVTILRRGIVTGWFAIVLALVRLYRTVKALKEFSIRAHHLFAELDAARARA